jgi:hypothetical protein
MGLPIALFALFLLVLIALSFAAVRLFGARGSDGKRDPAGCLMGCAAGAGLLVLGLLGLAALVAALVVHSASVAAEKFPVKRVYVGTEPDRMPGYLEELPEGSPAVEPLSPPAFESDPARPLHVVFEIDGELAVTERMEDWIREWSEGEAQVQIDERVGADGRTVTWVDVALPADWRDLREIEQDVRKYFPEASWARGLRIDFKSVSRDW